jgi:hypothetical protein
MRKRLLSAGPLLGALVLLGAPRAAWALLPTPTPTPSPSPTPTLGEIQVVSVSASTNDGNLPANTLDNNLSTRWSGYGDGAWIVWDMGNPRLLTAVKIAVYRGNERQNRFDLQVSGTGSTWTPVLTGAVTRTSTAEELYDIPDQQQVRYVRYVGHGSTASLWNSLTEVSLFTYRNDPTCSVTTSAQVVSPGQSLVVSAHSNLGIGQWGLAVVDLSTGQLQSDTNPIFTPARPPTAQGSFNVSWTLTAVRPGTVRFDVGVNGEIYDPQCGCYHFTNASGSSGPVTVLAEQTPTVTPTPTFTPTPTPTPTNIPTPDPTTNTPTEITIPSSAASASTNDGNVPANAVDNKLDTRWSGMGDGAWLKLDLGGSRAVSYVTIAVYKGNERRNKFDLQVSGDGTAWTTLSSGQSSGTTTAEERYDLNAPPARYLRYVGHGNDDPTKPGWNSVSEISVFAP